MCGIIGYVGARRATPILLEGLRRLEYRGYDSAGVAVLHEGQIAVEKRVGRVRQLAAALDAKQPGTFGIAHTRWATHGGVTQANAHPHADEDGRVVVVHNGIIENMTALKNRLQALGVVFRSETDTEVIVHLISLLYDGLPEKDGDSISADVAGDPVAAVRAAVSRLRGTWGLAVMFADHPGLIVAARNGSPLVVGLGEGETFLASDQNALVTHTRRVVYLEDGDMAVITPSGVETSALDDPATRAHDITLLEEDWGEAEQGDYPHFMLKEIHDQPEALRQCLRGRVVPEEGTARVGGLDLGPRELVEVNRVGLIGCGTSFNAAEVGGLVVEQLSRLPATAYIGSEFRYRNPSVDPRGLYFAVSQSGETADTLGCVKEIQLKGGRVYGVVNVVGSSIARQCKRGVYIHSGPEMAVASTKAFSNMVAALYLFALQLGRTRNMSPHAGRVFAEGLLQVPELVERYLADPGPIDEVVRWLHDAKLALFLGRGLSMPVAREGALKLMEVAYVPCLAYPSGEMKHGPIALLEEGTPVIVVAPDDSVKEKTLSNLQECRARGARICLIHTEGDDIAEHADVSIPVPRAAHWFSPFLTVLPLQLLAYKAGLAMGRDIDRPRNLAKSVTVE